MQSIRKRLNVIIVICAIIALVISAFFVNIAVNKTFNNYMNDIQEKRNIRLVEYFQQIYQRDGKWTESSGKEMLHEAYMSNYCLSLLDKNRNIIWEMDPNDIEHADHVMLSTSEGVYTTNTLAIEINGEAQGYLIIGQYSPILLSEEDVNFKLTINKSIIISVIAAIIIITIISLLVAKQFSAPIKAVADRSIQLSKGDYQAQLNITTDIYEIKDLIDNINDLGSKLSSQEMLRKRLVSDISHEIRTPLNILQNNLEAMIDGIKPVTEEGLIALNEEVIRFGKLLNNLNSLKQVDEEVDLHFQMVDLGELLSYVCRDFTLTAEEKEIDFQIDIQEENLIILGDEDKLKQVFINLLSNSIKFTPKNGTVRVTLKEEIGFGIVEVVDTGIGIDTEDLPFIFEHLYRGDKSRHKIEGSGIGLAIVKRILSLHSAEIKVRRIKVRFLLFILKKR